jgi:hypothetical protein
MAFSLSDRISNGRIRNDPGTGFRGGPADFGVDYNVGDKGSFGDDEGSNKGGPHSASGFRRMLMRTERTQGRLSGDIAAKKDFSGQGFKKPNYFGQGARRHGMHIGAGAPATVPAQMDGADVGE